jgi:hypothetical protein
MNSKNQLMLIIAEMVSLIFHFRGFQNLLSVLKGVECTDCTGFWGDENFVFCVILRWTVQYFNISLICTELERIRGEKVIFQKFYPFSSPSAQNWPKFGCNFWPF